MNNSAIFLYHSHHPGEEQLVHHRAWPRFALWRPTTNCLVYHIHIFISHISNMAVAWDPGEVPALAPPRGHVRACARTPTEDKKRRWQRPPHPASPPLSSPTPVGIAEVCGEVHRLDRGRGWLWGLSWQSWRRKQRWREMGKREAVVDAIGSRWSSVHTVRLSSDASKVGRQCKWSKEEHEQCYGWAMWSTALISHPTAHVRRLNTSQISGAWDLAISIFSLSQ